MLKQSCPNNLKKLIPIGRPSVTFSDNLEEEELQIFQDNQKLQNNKNILFFPSEKTPLFKQKNLKNKNKKILKLYSCFCQENKEENKFDQIEEEENPKIKFLVCCLSVPIIQCTRFIGFLFTTQIIIEIILLFKTTFSSSSFSSSFLLLELIPELIFLIIQIFCILFLFYGIKQKQPKYLKPFLYFGIFWNFVLLLLFIFCIIELIVVGKYFCIQIELTLNNFFNELFKKSELSYQETNLFFNEFAAYSTTENKNLNNLAIKLYGEDQTLSASQQPIIKEEKQINVYPSIWPTLILITSLLLIIIINCWLLNIVLLTYLYLKRARKQTKDEEF